MIAILLDVLIVGLAAWRLAALVGTERGPLAIFERLRAWIAGDADELTGWRYELTLAIECPRCLTVWCAIALWLVFPWAPVAVVILAAAGVAALLEEYARRA